MYEKELDFLLQHLGKPYQKGILVDVEARVTVDDGSTVNISLNNPIVRRYVRSIQTLTLIIKEINGLKTYYPSTYQQFLNTIKNQPIFLKPPIEIHTFTQIMNKRRNK